MLALAADHHGDLALIVELVGNLRPNKLSAVSNHRVRRAVEHARILRRFGEVVVVHAVCVVDADAQDFLRRRQWRQQLDLGDRDVRANTGNGCFRLIERLGAKDIEERAETA